MIEIGDYILDPNVTLEFEGQVLFKATNKQLISKNNKTIPANTLNFYCDKNVTIGQGCYICNDAKICSGVVLKGNNYIGTDVVLLKDVEIPIGTTITSSNTNINNQTADKVKEYFKN